MGFAQDSRRRGAGGTGKRYWNPVLGILQTNSNFKRAIDWKILILK